MRKHVDIGHLLAILRDAAQAEILPRFRNLSQGDIRQKTSAIDLVTEGDEAAERYIAKECARLYSDAVFIGEESVAADPRLLDSLDQAELAIVVDPIDGTANFAGGLPLFAVMAAIVVNGEAVGGIIYDPISDDAMLAEKGAGAYHRSRDGQTRRLTTATPVAAREAIGLISANYFEDTERAALLSRLTNIKVAANFRNAGHEYRLLASGGAHCSLYSKVMPWDHLPGCLLTVEAGGHVAMSDGSTYCARVRAGTLLSACNEDFWHVAREALLPID